MTVPRRTFLGLVGAVAGLPAAQAISQKLAAHGLMKSALGGGSIGGLMGMEDLKSAPTAASAPVLYHSFAEWWRQYGEASYKDSAHEVTFLAADILDMKSPSLQTKVEMQRRRNLAKIRKEREASFDRALSLNGVFKWWA